MKGFYRIKAELSNFLIAAEHLHQNARQEVLREAP